MTHYGKPVHIEGEVVRFAQVGVGGDGPLFQHLEEVLGLGFDQEPFADEIKGLVFGRRLPPVLGGAGFEFDDLIQDMLPGALADHRITVLQVNAGEAEVHGGLFAGFVEGQEQARGLGLVLGLEALEGFGGVVEGVVNALATQEQTIAIFHSSIRIEPIPETIPAVSPR